MSTPTIHLPGPARLGHSAREAVTHLRARALGGIRSRRRDRHEPHLVDGTRRDFSLMPATNGVTRPSWSQAQQRRVSR